MNSVIHSVNEFVNRSICYGIWSKVWYIIFGDTRCSMIKRTLEKSIDISITSVVDNSIYQKLQKYEFIEQN
jgi:hypothetical protein